MTTLSRKTKILADVDEIMQENIQGNTFYWLESFNNYRAKIDEKKNVIATDKYNIRYKHDGIEILSICSSLCSFGDDDKNNLFLNGELYNKSMRLMSNASVQSIVIMHHPIDWLSEEERYRFNTELSKSKTKFLCYGHMHEHSSINESYFNEDAILKLQAGKIDIRDGENKYTGYSIIELDDSDNLLNGIAKLRAYFCEQERFDSWLYRAENGIVKFSLQKGSFFNRDEFCRISKIIYDKFNEDELLCNVGVSKNLFRKLSDLFIEPNLMLESIETTDSGDDESDNISEISVTDILSNHRSYALYGISNVGKSTLLKYISLEYLLKQRTGDIDKVVLYLDLNNISKFNSINNIFSSLLELYTRFTEDDSIALKLKEKIESNNSVIIFDSVDRLTGYSIKYLMEFIKRYKGNKFILSSTSNMKTILSGLLEKNGVNWIDSVLLGGLDRVKVRELVNKWYPDTIDFEKLKINKFIDGVQKSGMGHNAFVYSIILSIYDKKSTASKEIFLHEVDIIENFLEILLQKHNLTGREIPQYKDLILLLGYIACKMYSSPSYKISDDDLHAHILSFRKNFFQDDLSIDAYKIAIIESGIVTPTPEGRFFYFSQACFFNYALAYFASKNKEFESTLCSVENVIKYSKVLEYLAAIRKNDLCLIEEINTWCNSYLTQLEIQDGFCGDVMALLQENNSIEFFDDVIDNDVSVQEEDVVEQSEIDKKLDQVAPLKSSPKTVERLEEVDDDFSIQTKFVHSISLFARVVRASEHISDRDERKRYFRLSMNFYYKFLWYAIHDYYRDVLPLLKNSFDDIITEIASKEGELENKGLWEKRFVNFLKFIGSIIPNHVFKMLYDDLINLKSKAIIKETILDVRDEELLKLPLIFSLCRMNDEEGFRHFKEIQKQLNEKEHLIFILFHELVYLEGYAEDVSSQHRRVAKDLIQKIRKNRKTNRLINSVAVTQTKIK